MENLNHVMTGAEDRRVDFKLTKVTPELVRAIEGVNEVKQENGRLYVYGTDDTDIHASQTIIEHGATILLMKPREYTLEEIFMKYYQKEAP